MSRGPAAPAPPVSPVLPTNARPGLALALLPLAGFLLWFVAGLPWGPPTDDVHLATWLGHLRNGAPAAGETLFVAFGGDPLAKGEVVLSVRGRVAGDALVFRRAPPGPAGGPTNEVHPDERP